MAEPSIDIQRIVSEVLAELGAAPSPRPGPDTAACPAPSQPAKTRQTRETRQTRTPAADKRELVISARVVTTAEIGDRLSGVRRLVVGPRAVVTPSVRDLLRAGDVTLVRAESTPQSVAADVRLIVTTLGKSFDSAGLIGALREEGVELDARSSDCVITTSRELAEELAKGQTLAVMLTSRPAIAMCVANRLPGVRAVLATDAAATAKATASIGANLLVISPRTISFFLLKQLIREFRSSGVRQCPGPEELIRHLG